jgi:gamma-glutamylcyclotransferase (GGCT)/AIG2-like uncharacterized protein YtfP
MYFVYGTLLNGFRNHHLIKHFIEKSLPAEVNAIRLVHFMQRGCPGIYESSNPDSRVKGDLIMIRRGSEVEAVKILDGLERFYASGDVRNLYERRTVKVAISESDSLVLTNPGSSSESISRKSPLSSGSGLVQIDAETYFVAFHDAERLWEGVPVVNASAAACWRSFVEERAVGHAGSEWAPKA